MSESDEWIKWIDLDKACLDAELIFLMTCMASLLLIAGSIHENKKITSK